MVFRTEDAHLELCHMLTKVCTTKQRYFDHNSTTGADPDEPVPKKEEKEKATTTQLPWIVQKSSCHSSFFKSRQKSILHILVCVNVKKRK